MKPEVSLICSHFRDILRLMVVFQNVNHIRWKKWSTVGQWLTLFPHSKKKKDPAFKAGRLGLFFVEFMFCLCLNWFSRGTLAFSHSPNHMFVVRLTGDSKVGVGVNVSVNGCLSFCVIPALDWWPDGWMDNSQVGSDAERSSIWDTCRKIWEIQLNINSQYNSVLVQQYVYGIHCLY